MVQKCTKMSQVVFQNCSQNALKMLHNVSNWPKHVSKRFQKCFPTSFVQKCSRKFEHPFTTVSEKLFKMVQVPLGPFQLVLLLGQSCPGPKMFSKSFENNWPKHVSKRAKMSQVVFQKCFQNALKMLHNVSNWPKHVSKCFQKCSPMLPVFKK